MTTCLLDILRKTLSDLEQHSEFRDDEPALADLRRDVTRAIGELELKKAGRTEEPAQLDPTPLHVT